MNRRLRDLIVAQVATHPTASPEEIAQLVANNTPIDQLRDYYRDLLVAPCRTISAQQQRQHHPKPKIPRTPQPRSPKLAERRTWWQQQLATTIILGAGETKPLADCTTDDLRQAEKECDAAIGRHEQRMSDYRHLIDLLHQHNAHRVKDLPEQHNWRKTA